MSEGDLVEWLAEPELRDDRRMDLGDKLEIENLVIKCRGWIGEAPFSLDVERTAQKLNASPDAWQKATRPEFSDRFVFTTFGVQSLGGVLHPSGVGLELVFRDDVKGINPGQRIHLHTVFPSARFLVTTSDEGSLGTLVKAEAKFAAEIVPPGYLTPLLGALKGVGLGSELKGSASIETALNNKHTMTWSTTAHSPIVEAFGEGDTRAFWLFHHNHGPLAGKTFETVTGLTTGRKKKGVEYDARMFLLFKIGPYPFRRYSEWVRLKTDWGD
ncbi:hypothetical protein [Rhizobium leguminosarum]|uniref:hypothetical protein n=1 Tax=Rhizobium leguminosarum TaxID=384 RepID=UPI001C950FAB|nr:hypothetical protein [Rhizobium leguminosarum]MBY5400951.1 hypothetical protein [Rhizobium leguminosarum]